MAQSYIAKHIGLHKSTISREIWRYLTQRGSGAKIYVAINADNKTHNRYKVKKKHIFLITDLKKQLKEL
jgi:IS30 family transposase